jgi:hypothetical protein
MDIFTHAALGTKTVPRKYFWWALLMGALPDILGLDGADGWALYHFSHSLLALGCAGIACYAWLDWRLALPYALHIFMDVPCHDSGTYSLFYIPFAGSLDPIKFSGFNWWNTPFGSMLEVLSAITGACFMYSTWFAGRAARLTTDLPPLRDLEKKYMSNMK